MVEGATHESFDNDWSGTGDHDVPYEFGRPRDRLTLLAQARLLVMRGYVMDVRQGVTGLAADGDIDWVRTTASGLFIPE